MTRDDLARALADLLRDPRAEADETPPNTAARDACLALWDDLAAEGFDPSGWDFTPREVGEVELDLDAEGGFALYLSRGDVLAWGVARNSGARHWIVRRIAANTSGLCDATSVARQLREAM